MVLAPWLLSIAVKLSDKGVLRNDVLIAFLRKCFCSVRGLIQDDNCMERFLHFDGSLSSALGFAFHVTTIMIV